VLSLAPLRFVGVISYGVYLLHQLCAGVVRPVLGVEDGPLLFLGTVPTVLVVAWLSFRFFETPLLRLKRRFEREPHEAGGHRLRSAEPAVD
jgi:peptidoglycan/LPS O-acetylase OafA/YrhL